MAKKNSVLEWKVVLSDAEWERGESLGDLLGYSAGESPRWKGSEGTRRMSRLWMAALLALLVVASATYVARNNARTGSAQLEKEFGSAAGSAIQSERANNLSVGLSENPAQATSTGHNQSSLWPCRIANRRALLGPQVRYDKEGGYVNDYQPCADTDGRALADFHGPFRNERDNIVVETDGVTLQNPSRSPH